MQWYFTLLRKLLHRNINSFLGCQKMIQISILYSNNCAIFTIPIAPAEAKKRTIIYVYTEFLNERTFSEFD